MLANFFMKSLQGDLFVKFCEVFMGWKHIDTLQMVPPSTKECVVNVFKVGSRKREVKSSVDTKEENSKSKKSYVDIFIHGDSLYWG